MDNDYLTLQLRCACFQLPSAQLLLSLSRVDFIQRIMKTFFAERAARQKQARLAAAARWPKVLAS